MEKKAVKNADYMRMKSIKLTVFGLLTLVVLLIVCENKTNIKKARKVQNSRNVPIEFYGQIVDENGKPLSAVNIEVELTYFGWIVNPGYYPSREKRTLTSGSDGRFEIKKDDGLAFSIRSMTKQGYEFENNGRLGFSYKNLGVGKTSSDISTAESPLIVHAYKKGNTVPMMHDEIRITCEPDGRSCAADFLSRKIVDAKEKGDVRVSFTRDKNADWRGPSSWTVELAVIDGGILESNDPFMYKAPVTGYAEKWVLSVDAKSTNYIQTVRKKFYYASTSRNVYGRMEVELMPFFREELSAARIDYWFNVSGSTNLEYDPLKRLSR